MSYVINNSRGNIVAVVPDGTINTTATSVNLVGRGVTPYGLPENENYVYLLENFASTVAPLAPVLGQLWYNSSSDVISSYNTSNAWSALASQTYVQNQKSSPAFTRPKAVFAVALSSNTICRIDRVSGVVKSSRRLSNAVRMSASLISMLSPINAADRLPILALRIGGAS